MGVWLLYIKIFFEVLEIPDIFFFFFFFFGGGGGGVNSKCWARAYVCRKNESIPPPLPWESHIIFFI